MDTAASYWLATDAHQSSDPYARTVCYDGTEGSLANVFAWAPGSTALAGRAGLETASLGLVGERLLAGLLSLGLVDEFDKSTLVLESATLRTPPVMSAKPPLP